MTTQTINKPGMDLKALGLPADLVKDIESGKARKLGNENLARIDMRETVGSWFKGTYIAQEPCTINNKPATRGIFAFEAGKVDAVKWDREARAEVEHTLTVDERFETLMPTVLKNGVSKLALGARLLVVYKGKAESQKGGDEYHDFDVYAL